MDLFTDNLYFIRNVKASISLELPTSIPSSTYCIYFSKNTEDKKKLEDPQTITNLKKEQIFIYKIKTEFVSIQDKVKFEIEVNNEFFVLTIKVEEMIPGVNCSLFNFCMPNSQINGNLKVKMLLYPLDIFVLNYFYYSVFGNTFDLSNIIDSIINEIVLYDPNRYQRQLDSLYFAAAVIFLFRESNDLSNDILNLIPAGIIYSLFSAHQLTELKEIFLNEFKETQIQILRKKKQISFIPDSAGIKKFENKKYKKILKAYILKINSFITDLEDVLFDFLLKNGLQGELNSDFMTQLNSRLLSDYYSISQFLVRLKYHYINKKEIYNITIYEEIVNLVKQVFNFLNSYTNKKRNSNTKVESFDGISLEVDMSPEWPVPKSDKKDQILISEKSGKLEFKTKFVLFAEPQSALKIKIPYQIIEGFYLEDKTPPMEPILPKQSTYSLDEMPETNDSNITNTNLSLSQITNDSNITNTNLSISQITNDSNITLNQSSMQNTNQNSSQNLDQYSAQQNNFQTYANQSEIDLLLMQLGDHPSTNTVNNFNIIIYDGAQLYTFQNFDEKNANTCLELLEKYTNKKESQSFRGPLQKKWKKDQMLVLRTESFKELVLEPGEKVKMILDNLLSPSTYSLSDIIILQNSCIKYEDIAIDTLDQLKKKWKSLFSKDEGQQRKLQMIKVTKKIFIERVVVSSKKLFKELMDWIDSLQNTSYILVEWTEVGQKANKMVQKMKNYSIVNVHQIKPNNAGEYFNEELIKPYLFEYTQLPKE